MSSWIPTARRMSAVRWIVIRQCGGRGMWIGVQTCRSVRTTTATVTRTQHVSTRWADTSVAACPATTTPTTPDVPVSPQICIKYSRFITCQSNTSKGRGHDRLPNWNPKNGGMLIRQPISSCLTNHRELCMSRLLNNQPRRISIYRLQRRPSFSFESSVSSVSSTPMTSGDPVGQSACRDVISTSLVTLNVTSPTYVNKTSELTMQWRKEDGRTPGVRYFTR